MDQRTDRFLRLFLVHQHDLRAFILAALRDVHRAEDAFQEVSLVLWRRFDDYDPGRPFAAWAYGIAKHKMDKEMQRSRRGGVHLSADALDAVGQAYEARTAADGPREHEALRSCLERLGARARRLLALRYEQDLSVSQIAEQERSTFEAVKKFLVRIRRDLHRCISHRMGGVDP